MSIKFGILSGKLEGLKSINLKSITSNNNKAKQELRLLDGKSNKINYKRNGIEYEKI